MLAGEITSHKLNDCTTEYRHISLCLLQARVPLSDPEPGSYSYDRGPSVPGSLWSVKGHRGQQLTSNNGPQIRGEERRSLLGMRSHLLSTHSSHVCVT